MPSMPAAAQPEKMARFSSSAATWAARARSSSSGSRLPRWMSSISARSTVNGTRNSASGSTRRWRLTTPAATSASSPSGRASSRVARPSDMASWIQPPSPTQSTRRRAASSGVSRSLASASISFHARTGIGALSRSRWLSEVMAGLLEVEWRDGRARSTAEVRGSASQASDAERGALLVVTGRGEVGPPPPRRSPRGSLSSVGDACGRGVGVEVVLELAAEPLAQVARGVLAEVGDALALLLGPCARRSTRARRPRRPTRPASRWGCGRRRGRRRGCRCGRRSHRWSRPRDPRPSPAGAGRRSPPRRRRARRGARPAATRRPSSAETSGSSDWRS